jgi:hypothetical protein
MKILAALILIGPLMLIGAVPAPAAPVQLAASGNAAADRDSYMHQAQAVMQEWQGKLHDFGEKAEAKGKTVDSAAKDELNKAWTKAKIASGDLQAASDESWESAKSSFDAASRELAADWHKIYPDDK